MRSKRSKVVLLQGSYGLRGAYGLHGSYGRAPLTVTSLNMPSSGSLLKESKLELKFSESRRMAASSRPTSVSKPMGVNGSWLLASVGDGDGTSSSSFVKSVDALRQPGGAKAAMKDRSAGESNKVYTRRLTQRCTCVRWCCR